MEVSIGLSAALILATLTFAFISMCAGLLVAKQFARSTVAHVKTEASSRDVATKMARYQYGTDGS